MDKKNKACKVVSAYRNQVETKKKQGKKYIKTDVTGSYTGTGEDNSKPIQDADDL